MKVGVWDGLYWLQCTDGIPAGLIIRMHNTLEGEGGGVSLGDSGRVLGSSSWGLPPGERGTEAEERAVSIPAGHQLSLKTKL